MIEQLSETDFNNDVPIYREEIPWLQEKAWFRLNTTIGILIFDQADQDWSFVVCRPDGVGVYRAIDLAHSFKSAEEATSELHRKMQSVEVQ